MAKNAITDYDTDPSNNTDVGNIGIEGSNIPSNFDNSQREIMSHLADMNAGTSPLHDTFCVADPADLTKKVRIDAGNVSTGQTRTLSMPDEDVDLSLVKGISGQVATFAMNTAPTGWLKANGSAVSRTTYADLYAAIGTTFGSGDGSTTFNLPDLRGEFIRGWDDGRGTDTGRTFGSSQSHQLEDHYHGINSPTTYSSSIATGSAVGLAQRTNYDRFTGDVENGNAGSETRPRNIALLVCIKY